MTLPALAAFLRRRIVPLAACLVAGLLGGLLLTAVTPKTYKASTRLFVNIPTARSTSEAIQGVQLSSNLLESYARIATSRTAAERVALTLNKRFTSGQIASKLSATPQPNTLLIDVSATDRNAAAARDIADAGGKVLAAYVTELEAGREGAIEARVIDPARLPTSPSSPKASRNLAVGLLLGLVVGVGLALAMESSTSEASTTDQSTAESPWTDLSPPAAPAAAPAPAGEPTPAPAPSPPGASEGPGPVPPPAVEPTPPPVAARRPRKASSPARSAAPKAPDSPRTRTRGAGVGGPPPP